MERAEESEIVGDTAGEASGTGVTAALGFATGPPVITVPDWVPRVEVGEGCGWPVKADGLGEFPVEPEVAP